ncbi:hypothetical protein DFJ77DRAFT_509705 [Powellomyces hirtus]|nr:hypothetical protein DFJ77DRAFT_509705 [Powellomyces hirtus]
MSGGSAAADDTMEGQHAAQKSGSARHSQEFGEGVRTQSRRTSQTSAPSLADVMVATVDNVVHLQHGTSQNSLLEREGAQKTSLASSLPQGAERDERQSHPDSTGAGSQEEAGLGFSVQQYGGDAFNEFRGAGKVRAGTPRKRPLLAGGGRKQDEPVPAIEHQNPGAAISVDRKAGATAPTQQTQKPPAPPATKSAAPPHLPRPNIKVAPSIPLPPLRTRRGCIGISNRHLLGSRYEDKLTAYGLTKAGTAGLKWADRVIVYPGENGRPDVAEGKNRGGKVELTASIVTGLEPPAYPSYPHSFREILMLQPESQNTRRPLRPHAPTFLHENFCPDPINKYLTRYGCNTEWHHDSFATVQPEPTSHYYMPEKERLQKAGWVDTERGRKRGVANVPGRRLEVETTF